MPSPRTTEIIETDFLIIGSGVAGLTCAIKIAECSPSQRVTIITKSESLESNTRLAQGGIAVVVDQNSDSIEKHVGDTLIAGDGLCDEYVVRTIVSEGPARLKELMDWGIQLDNKNKSLALGREGGHTENRIVHQGDSTGKAVSDVLSKRVAELNNIQLLKGIMAIDLSIGKNGNCEGVTWADKKGKLGVINSGATILASGGIGQVYSYTTNPSIATGDGIGMAARAKANISGMEFIQFHPTALYHHGLESPFLISEAVRGAGARLKNIHGKYFMKSYHAQADLAPRDVVARAVVNEMNTTDSDHVLLDCTEINFHDLREHFPTIFNTCKELGLDISKQEIPVKPAAHYLCGGIDSDLNGETSIKNLFAIGECANTGLHGSNRLASNSILEGLVMAHRCAKACTSHHQKPTSNSEAALLPIGNASCDSIRKEVQELMEEHIGIIRTPAGLANALSRLKQLLISVEADFQEGKLSVSGLEVRNMLYTAIQIVEESIARKKNIGGYFNSDMESIRMVASNQSNRN